MIKPECQQCGQRVGWIGVIVNVIMVILKVGVGITSGSRACLADALHSSANIVTAFAIFISRKMVGKPIDDDHPYGYGKIEFIAAGAVGVVILILTAGLIITTLHHVIYNPVPPPHMSALWISLLSIAANEVLFRYFKCVGTQLRSQTITANAWANRADCFSSLAVLVGVIGARLGFHHLDPIAAFVVAAIIIKVSISSMKASIAGLMDGNVSPEISDAFKAILPSLDKVTKIGRLRARLLGNKIWIDVVFEIDADHTVGDCDHIRQQVERHFREQVQHVGNVLVSFKAANQV